MGILIAVLIAVEVITSFLLIAIILVQKTKSEGLGLAFGSGMGETLFGSRAGNVLTRITVILACIFLANTLFLGMLYSGHRGGRESLMSRMAPVAAPQQPAPMGGAPASAPAAGGAPTLPGTPFDQQGSAPVAAPAEQAPVVAPEAAPAPEAPAAQPQP
jgi:preprotein translocase subunit SecG